MTETDHFWFDFEATRAFTESPAALWEFQLPNGERRITTAGDHDDLARLFAVFVPRSVTCPLTHSDARRHVAMRAYTLDFTPFLNVVQAHAAIPVSDTEQNFSVKRKVEALRERKRIDAHVEFTRKSQRRFAFESVRELGFIAAHLFFAGGMDSVRRDVSSTIHDHRPRAEYGHTHDALRTESLRRSATSADIRRQLQRFRRQRHHSIGRVSTHARWMRVSENLRWRLAKVDDLRLDGVPLFLIL